MLLKIAVQRHANLLIATAAPQDNVLQYERRRLANALSASQTKRATKTQLTTAFELQYEVGVGVGAVVVGVFFAHVLMCMQTNDVMLLYLLVVFHAISAQTIVMNVAHILLPNVHPLNLCM